MKYATAIILAILLILPRAVHAADTPLDTDHDGLSDELESKLGTDLANLDTDGDGYQDGLEVKNGFNPLKGQRDRSVPRSVTVDIAKQKLIYYFNGVEIGVASVSTGVRGMDTPQGEFKIIRKRPTVHYKGQGYDYPNTKWNLEFKKGIYLHGAYWHNQFGKKPMSHGCVNIAYANAEKLYKFLDVGDKVKIFGKVPIKNLLTKIWTLTSPIACAILNYVIKHFE